MSSSRHRLRRLKSLGSYDRAVAYRILDDGLLAHVSFADGAQPFVIPMAYVRDGDALLLHGAVASRLQRALGSGVETCVCVTLLDGLVLARSVFNHSMNYRSVVAFGKAEPVVGAAAKRAALQLFTDRMLPGRWQDARQPNTKELGATAVMQLHMTDITVKMRTGPPDDAVPDLELPVWAGVLPMRTTMDSPIADARSQAELPDYLERFVSEREQQARRE